jgi:hypothetical protein
LKVLPGGNTDLFVPFVSYKKYVNMTTGANPINRFTSVIYIFSQ